MHLIYISIGFYVMGYSVALEDLKSARILKYDFDNIGTGPYHFSFDTSDGISRQEVGQVELAGTEDEFVKISGSFSYPGPDGVIYEVRYTADDQGFHPEGDHIMVPPFVPWIHHHDHHKHHHTDHDDKKIGFEAPNKTVENHLEPLGTSPKPSAEYSGFTNPKPKDYNGDNLPRTPQPPLKFDLLFKPAPDVADGFPPGYPKPIAQQPNDGNYAEKIFSTTPESPQPSLIIHSTPTVDAEYSSISSPNPGFPRTIDGNYIVGSANTPSPDTNPVLHSTPPAAINYSSYNPPKPILPRIYGTTPQPLRPGSISSSSPNAHIPVGYLLPRPEMELPIRGVEGSRAYIPPVSISKPLVR